MFFSKSKEVIDLVSTHSRQVIFCFERYIDMMNEIMNGCEVSKRQELYIEIKGLETGADVIRRDIIRKLFEGRMLVTSRKSIMRLIEGIDNVADITESIIRDLYIQKIEKLEEYRVNIVQVNNITLKQLKILIDIVSLLVTKYEVDEMLNKISIVEKLESEVDTLEYKTISSIFESDLELAHKTQLKVMINRIGAMSDVIEDLSDEVEIIMMSRNV